MQCISMRCVTFKELFKYKITNKTGAYDRINETSRPPQQANREECFHSPRLCFLFFLDFIVLWISLLEVFFRICLYFRFPQFLCLSAAAFGSHFRSGCKGNFGNSRECKVKPPVFWKNLQPCGSYFSEKPCILYSLTFLSARNSTPSALEFALKQKTKRM